MDIFLTIVRIVLIVCCVVMAIRSIKSFIEARQSGDEAGSSITTLIISLVFSIYLIVRIVASKYN